MRRILFRRGDLVFTLGLTDYHDTPASVRAELDRALASLRLLD